MPRAEYQAFLDDIGGAAGKPRLVRLYHAVRNIPYGAAGVRDPVKVIESNVGSCSGKHVLLRDLLRGIGCEAQIITILTHFNKAIPLHDSYPQELRRMIVEEEVCDFHHFARVRLDGEWTRLDATWHDALAPYGFPVNNKWNGGGDTRLAAEPIREYAPAEDLAAFKEALVASMPAREREKRAKFFALLTGWIAAL